MKIPLNDDFFTHIILDENNEIDDNETERQLHSKIAMDWEEEFRCIELKTIDDFLTSCLNDNINNISLLITDSKEKKEYAAKFIHRIEMLLQKLILIEKYGI